MFLGTRADNMRDAATKGRTAQGERQNSAKLTAEAVRDIRRRRASGEARRSIAEDYGISPTTVSNVMTRTWQHI